MQDAQSVPLRAGKLDSDADIADADKPVLVMDRHQSHKNKGIKEILEERFDIMFTPPTSCFLNTPIGKYRRPFVLTPSQRDPMEQDQATPQKDFADRCPAKQNRKRVPGRSPTRSRVGDRSAS